MPTQAAIKLDLFRKLLNLRKKEEEAEFKRISMECEHYIDNSGRHGMYAQIPDCRASGIRTLKSCNIDICPAIH